MIVGVPDEDTLLDIADQFTNWCAPNRKIDAPWTLFYEPDINEHTALASYLTKDQARRLPRLPLLFEEGR